jgi:prepilin-type N-terminal cleavage/methylation domain-containing protein/prepilin-type processing-associated H-X9-DG protein
MKSDLFYPWNRADKNRPCIFTKRQAFTLVELLVVISIIAVLLAIMMPSLQKARNQAKKMVCLSNMRQIGITLNAYMIDSKNCLPPSSCHLSNPDQYWLCILNKYSGTPLLFRCPSDKAKIFVNWSKPLAEQPKNARWSSFALNALLDPGCTINGGCYNSVLRIRHPASCIYVAECPSSWTNYDHLHPDGWESLQQAKGQVDWNRHNGNSNYIFTDGHVENLKIEKTWDYPTINYWLPESAPSWPR